MILLKSGISYTSLKNAEENLAAEMKDFDFDRTHAECVRLWNDELAKVSVEGGTDEEKRVFYTALYHTLIDPRLCSDINGEYTGADKRSIRLASSVNGRSSADGMSSVARCLFRPSSTRRW